MRRTLGWLAAGALTLALAALAADLWWQGRMRPDRPPLEANWDAVVTVLAGDGRDGVRDGAARHARFSDPFGVAAGDAGVVYVADAGEAGAIRRVTRDGRVATLARGLDTPSGLARDARGVLYVAETGRNAIARLDADGDVSTLAGDGTAGYADGPGHAARFNGPVGVAVDPATGRVIVADTYNDRIRAIAPDGTVTTLAGSGQLGWLDGPALEARFDTPCDVALGPDGAIYIADTGNHAVRRLTPDGQVTTIAPQGAAGLFRPFAIAVGPDGLLYVAGDDNRIVEIAPDGSARTVAGSGTGFADGDGASALFRRPSGLAVVEPGRLIVADGRNRLIRLVAARSQIERRPPPSPWIAPAFDAEAFGLPPLLWPFDSMVDPFEITGTMGEPRGGPGGERFHAGLDVSGDQGLMVYAVRDGVVSTPVATSAFDTLNESIRIGPLLYAHLRVGRRLGDRLFDRDRFLPAYDERGRLIRVRVKRGTRFASGDRLGTLNAFNHAHLNVGWPGEEHNPLRFGLVRFVDTVRPTIPPGGVRLFTEAGQPVTARQRGRLVVTGRVQAVVDAWDQVDGNAARRRLGLYALGYQVLRPDGTPAPGFERPRMTQVFDRFAADDTAARLVFASGSGIPEYGAPTSRFLYVVTNTLRDGIARRAFWDTDELPAGDYTLRIVAEDINGNQAMANRDVAVTITRASTLLSPGS